MQSDFPGGVFSRNWRSKLRVSLINDRRRALLRLHYIAVRLSYTRSYRGFRLTGPTSIRPHRCEERQLMEAFVSGYW